MRQINRFFLSAISVFLAFAGQVRADLDGDIRAVLQDKLLEKAKVGIEIVHLAPQPATARVIYKHNVETPLMPASNMKVLTTSAALDELGADFKFKTLLIQHGQDVVLIGDGDPTFGDAEFLKKLGWNTTTVFERWAQELKKANVTAVRNVLVDDSVFDETFFHPHWDPAQSHNRFSAEIAGMTMNVGCVDFFVNPTGVGRTVSYTLNPPTRYVTVQNTCVGGRENAIVLDRQRESNSIILKGTAPTRNEVPASITIHDPAMFAATVLAETLAANGIKVEGKVARDRSYRAKALGKNPEYPLLAVHETPLIQVISRANKDSMNPYAESLCKRVGYAASGQSGSWENGPAAVGAFVRKAGAAAEQFHLDDGCGLSRENRVSAEAMMHVLRYNYYGKNRSAFIDSLAVAGQDGTLDERFKGSDLRGRVFAKTGYIVGVSALSGYLKTRDDQWYAFSILMNGLPRGMNLGAKQLQERIVKAIDRQAR
jgi:D-alanyl-D-alanine carboxypeptidase/D-alanyl-D-alanine-endopeptidase (penicillin-binding protein 4)